MNYLVKDVDEIIKYLYLHQGLIKQINSISKVNTDSSFVANGMNFNLSSNVVRIDKDKVYSYESLDNEPVIFKNDTWVSTLKSIRSEYNSYIKDEKRRQEIEQKNKEDRLDQGKKEVEKRNFGLEYDKSKSVVYDRYESLVKFKESLKGFWEVIKSIIFVGLLLILSFISILLAGWWSILFIPIIWSVLYNILFDSSYKIENQSKNTPDFYEPSDLDFDDARSSIDEDILQVAKDYGIDHDEAEEVLELVDELGIDEDDAVMIQEEGL